MRFLKHLFFAGIILASFGLVATSCGGGNSDGITAETKISGPLGKFFEVVDKNYKLNTDGMSPKISIQIKRIAEGGPKEASWSSEPTFNIDIMDADDNVLGSDKSSVVIDKEQLEAIFALGVGETATLTFKLHGQLDGASKLKVSSTWKEEKEKSEESSGTDEDDSDYSDSSSSMSPDDDSSDDSGSDYSSAYEEGMRQAKGAYDEGRRQAKEAYDEGMRQAKEAMDKGMEEAYGKAGAKAIKKLSGYDKAVKDYEREVDKAWNDLGED
ncbi:MAG: hypothetical protein IJG81_04020 [Muribaculaceae bacterium]|nr:hypothetical protein [Muribaculaceae bacterium]